MCNAVARETVYIRDAGGKADNKVVDRFSWPINLQKWSSGKSGGGEGLGLGAICLDGRTCFFVLVRTGANHRLFVPDDLEF